MGTRQLGGCQILISEHMLSTGHTQCWLEHFSPPLAKPTTIDSALQRNSTESLALFMLAHGHPIIVCKEWHEASQHLVVALSAVPCLVADPVILCDPQVLRKKFPRKKFKYCGLSSTWRREMPQNHLPLLEDILILYFCSPKNQLFLNILERN